MLLPDTPLGFRADGRPIWAFAGGAPDGDGGDGGDGGGSEGDGDGDSGSGGAVDTTVGADGLTEAGRNAVAKERATLKAVRTELRGYKAVMAEHGVTSPEALRERLTAPSGGQQGQQQPPVDAEAIRRQVETEVRTESNRRIALAEVKAAAAEAFEYPEDAAQALAGEVDDLLNDDGSPDTEAIKRALAGLLQRKPRWAKDTEAPPPSYDGGPRGTPGAPTSFSGFIRDQVAAKRGR
jgi:hypothetical protein